MVEFNMMYIKLFFIETIVSCKYDNSLNLLELRRIENL